MIRHFRGSDFGSLLTLWNRAQPHDPVTRVTLIKKLFLDPNFTPEGLLVSERDGAPAGVVNLTRRRVPDGLSWNDDAPDARTGFINVCLVSPDEDEFTVGTRLLDAAEALLAAWGLTRCTTAYPPLYFTQGIESEAHPGLVRAFTERGYSGVASVAKELDLDAYEEAPAVSLRRAALETEGYRVRPMRPEDVSAVLDPHAPFSNPSWAEEFRVRLAAGADLDTMHVAVRRTTGAETGTEAEIIVGACVFGDPNSDAGRFGPFGVSPDERGHGLGSVLLADTLAEMKRRGLHRAWMQWADLSGPAHTVYTRVGFRVTKHYLTFTKDFKK